MSYPFPGMNPWLENPQIWRGIHMSLINALRDYLAPLLEPRYFVDVESHTYVTAYSETRPKIRYPDLSVIRTGERKVAEPVTAFAPEFLETQVKDLPFVETDAVDPIPAPILSHPIVIQLPDDDPIEDHYLKIRLIESSEVVTVVEILSHTNKRSGENRQKYLRKRRKFLSAPVHFVEIDLLRAWEPMPFLGHVPGDYRIFIHRREQEYQAHLYPFTVRQTVPIFPLPLLPEDQEPPVNLGPLLKDIYLRARYHLILDYSKPPEPPLSQEDAGWAQDLFAQAAPQ